MALVRIPEQQRTLETPEAVKGFLAGFGIEFEQWQSKRAVPATATAEAVLEAYADKVAELKARGGYVTADVIDVTAETPGLDAMLAREGRSDMAAACFRFLPDRVRLDLCGWAAEDIFAHS